MKFTKMHGLGNDFILFEGRVCGPEAAKRLCNRRCGIGADGVIFVLQEESSVRMALFNSDGSEAEMCGNGIRCFSRYVFDRGMVSGQRFRVETLAGPQHVEVNGQSISVNMGSPRFERELIPVLGTGEYRHQRLAVLDREFTASAVLLGVPHLTVWVDEVTDELVERYGPAIETLPLFPGKINVNFARVLGPGRVQVRTWERGCGRTLACGTGSSSVAVCCADAGLTGRSVDIELALGSLHIDWLGSGDVVMSGPAEYSFTGEVEL